MSNSDGVISTSSPLFRAFRARLGGLHGPGALSWPVLFDPFGDKAQGRPILHWILLSFLCGFLFFYHLDRRDLWSSHEARAAQDAQTMLDDGDWLLPRL